MGASYSYDWALEVFERFYEKHTRAAEFLRRIYELEDFRVVEWVATDQKKWNNFKKAVVYVERTARSIFSWADQDYPTVVKYYRRVLNKKFFENTDIVVDTDS